MPQPPFDGLFWLFMTVVPLLFLQRRLHFEIQAVFLLVTRRPDFTIALFSLLFLPGVVLHELSHYFMARILLVRTGRISLLPQPMANGKLRLGYVETAATDWLRDGLIGSAPLLTGGLFVAYAGLSRLELASAWGILQSQGVMALPDVARMVYSLPDFWLWFYLTFVVSSTMLPSESDRRAWLPLGLTGAALLIVALLAGAGPWLLETLAMPLNAFFLSVAAVFAVSVLVHIVFLLPAWGLHRLVQRLTGLKIVA